MRENHKANAQMLYKALTAAIARLDYVKRFLPAEERQAVDSQLETLRLTLSLVPPDEKPAASTEVTRR